MKSSMRPQPPAIDDPERNEYDGWEIGKENDIEVDDDGEVSDEEPNWQKRGKDAYQFSTSYIDSNYRRQWEDSIRAFNNQHSSDSKYNSESYRKRSNIYRPKTRTIIRKNEAAAAAAFFSNMDRISVSPMNPSIKEEVIGSSIMQQLIQYRLTKSIPWFQVVMGAIQDAQVQGAVAAHVYWKYSTRKKDEKLENVEDMPCIDLIPIENIRIDPAAHWVDPVNSSPYVIHLIPMYVGDVKQRMKYPDPKGRRWKELPDSVFLNSESPDDSTRRARIGVQDPTQQKREISDYDICWVHRHIHRWNGTDYQFYMLDSEHLLSDPEPLEAVVFHGKRPYVVGVAILETHKPLPASLPKLTEGLQSEANEIANQRLDNVKFVLNKRWFAKRGKNVDLASLVRNVPGGITLLDDPENDVKEITWPDVTASSYQEQDRLNVDFDELAGNFSPAAMRQNRMARESEGTMLALQAPSNLLTEYLLKTFTETFIQPVLRHIVLLEQAYETDQTVLAIAGQKSKAFQKFGIDKVTDEMLDKELTTMVNVGMGATDPVLRVQRFAFALQTFQAVSLKPPPGINLAEVWKEISALSGYQDGERFTLGQDAEAVNKQQMQIKQLMMVIQQLKMQLKDKHDANVVKLETAKLNNQTKLVTKAMEEHNENRQLLAGHYMKIEQDQLSPNQPQQPVNNAQL